MRQKGNVLVLGVMTGTLFFWSPTPSEARLVVFTDQVAWSSASSGVTTITFAGLSGNGVPNPDAEQAYPNGLTVSGVKFASDPGSQRYLDVRTDANVQQTFLYGPPYGTLCYGSCYSGPANAGIQVTLPPGSTSVGWYFANTLQSGLPGVSYSTGLTVTFADGTTYSNAYTGSVYLPIGDRQFVGFVSDSPITSFEIQGPGYPTIEDFSFGVAAGTQAPVVVSSIVRAADFQPDIAVDDFGTVYGSGLADATYTANVYPWPTKLGSTEVYACQYATQGLQGTGCTFLPLIFASPGQVNFYVPASVAGPYITVRVNGVVDSNEGTKAFQIGAPTAPAIFSEGYDCFVDSRYQDAFKNCGLTWTQPATNAANRGAVLDQDWQLVDSSNPVRLGDYVSIWMSGLGEFKGEVWMYNVPVYGLSGDTNYPINTVFSGEVGPGLFQVTTQIPLSLVTGGPNGYPPAWPCGNYQWEVSLGVRGAGGSTGMSNLVQIPVQVNSSDIPGCH